MTNIRYGLDKKYMWTLERFEKEPLPILAASVATVRPKVSAILTVFAFSAHCFRWKVKVRFSALWESSIGHHVTVGVTECIGELS